MIVIGDVHGCYKSLLALLAKLPPDQKVAFVGDLIDRGPSSAQVVKFVREGNYPCVMGNHEQMMYSALTYREGVNDFARNGGDTTIDSYGIKWLAEDMKNCEQLQVDLIWMENLPLYLEFPDVKNEEGRHLLVTHSSAHSVWHRKDKWEDGHDQWVFEQALLWNRLPNIMSIDGIFNIFGHTPHDDNPRIKSCYANVDTGCAYIHYKKDGLAKLTALQFPEMIVYQQDNIDMEEPKADNDGTAV